MSSVSTDDDSHQPIPRMKSEDRRELILTAATDVFGQYGYHGSTTDQIAKAAGVSQPYVVRMFGTKEALFLAVLGRALGRLIDSFEAEIEAGEDDLHERLGAAYGALLADRGLLLSLMHAFVLGSDPAIGAAARRGFLDVYRLLRHRAGFTTQEAHDFLAHGMLLNTMVGIRMAAEDDDDARELVDCVAPTASDLLARLART